MKAGHRRSIHHQSTQCPDSEVHLSFLTANTTSHKVLALCICLSPPQEEWKYILVYCFYELKGQTSYPILHWKAESDNLYLGSGKNLVLNLDRVPIFIGWKILYFSSPDLILPSLSPIPQRKLQPHRDKLKLSPF